MDLEGFETKRAPHFTKELFKYCVIIISAAHAHCCTGEVGVRKRGANTTLVHTGLPEEAAGVTRATVRTTDPVPVDSRQ